GPRAGCGVCRGGDLVVGGAARAVGGRASYVGGVRDGRDDRTGGADRLVRRRPPTGRGRPDRGVLLDRTGAPRAGVQPRGAGGGVRAPRRGGQRGRARGARRGG